MEKPDVKLFVEAMTMLSSTFNIELTEMRFQTYWNALQGYSIAAVTWACMEAAKDATNFPFPVTLRGLAHDYRDRRERPRATPGVPQVPARTAMTDAEALLAIRTIMDLLDKKMDMASIINPSTRMLDDDPLHYEPTVDPAVAKAKLRAQFQQLLAEESEGDDDVARTRS
jgi:hypothetical protein